MGGVKGMSGAASAEARSVLSNWEWEEAEADYRAGVPSRVLAERYGISSNTLRRRMARHKVRSPRKSNWEKHDEGL